MKPSFSKLFAKQVVKKVEEETVKSRHSENLLTITDIDAKVNELNQVEVDSLND